MEAVSQAYKVVVVTMGKTTAKSMDKRFCSF